MSEDNTEREWTTIYVRDSDKYRFDQLCKKIPGDGSKRSKFRAVIEDALGEDDHV